MEFWAKKSGSFCEIIKACSSEDRRKFTDLRRTDLEKFHPLGDCNAGGEGFEVAQGPGFGAAVPRTEILRVFLSRLRCWTHSSVFTVFPFISNHCSICWHLPSLSHLTLIPATQASSLPDLTERLEALISLLYLHSYF